MKNILIPTDFSENATNAITYALEYFSGVSVNFYLLHVQLKSRDEDTGEYSFDSSTIISDNKSLVEFSFIILLY